MVRQIVGGSGAGKTTLGRELSRTRSARLTRRTALRLWRNEEQWWNGNGESFKGAFYGFDGLFIWTVRMHWGERHQYPAAFRATPHVRLCSPNRVKQRWADWVPGISSEVTG